MITILLDAMGFGLIMPVLPRLLMRVGSLPLDAAIEAGAWMSLAMAVASFIAAPVLGNLSDALGRRKVLLVALAGLAANYLVLAWASSVGMIVFGRVLTGLFGGSFGPAQLEGTAQVWPQRFGKQPEPVSEVRRRQRQSGIERRGIAPLAKQSAQGRPGDKPHTECR